MVDAQHVGMREGALHTRHPPGKAFVRHAVPAVQRVAPALAVGRVVVWRHAGHGGQAVFRVHLVQVGPGPDVGAVVRHEDGHVAHQQHTALMGVGAQAGHLLVEAPLHEGVFSSLLCQALLRLRQGCGFAADQLGFPIPPGLAAVLVLQCGEERPFGQPAAFAALPAFERLLVFVVAVGQETSGGFAHSLPAPGNDAGVVHTRLVETWRPGDGLGGQPAPVHQGLQRHHQTAAGKGRRALVRRIARADGVHRQHLPHALARPRQPVDESPRLSPRVAHAVRAGQGGEVQHHASAALDQVQGLLHGAEL